MSTQSDRDELVAYDRASVDPAISATIRWGCRAQADAIRARLRAAGETVDEAPWRILADDPPVGYVRTIIVKE